MEEIIKRAIRSNDPALINQARILLIHFKMVLESELTEDNVIKAIASINDLKAELTHAMGSEFNA